MTTILVEYKSLAGLELEGNYTLSNGISPSVINITSAPKISVDLIGSVIFSDGDRSIEFRDCRQVDGMLNEGESSRKQVWRFWDHRWRWRYGCVNAHFNAGFAPGVKPKAGTVEAEEAKSARAIANFLLDAMGEGPNPRDVKALPVNDFPDLLYDFDNPAQKLSELVRRYGAVICFDPTNLKTTICNLGEGSEVDLNLPVLSLGIKTSPPNTPAELQIVADHTEHEIDLALEAVGLDMDGTFKSVFLAAGDGGLSYKPANGWGNPFGFNDITDQKKRERAMKTVFRVYRVVGKQDVFGWKLKATLDELVPISGDLIVRVKEEATDGTMRTVRKEAYVHGVFSDPERYDGLNTAQKTKYPGPFEINEEKGLVIFPSPVMRLQGGSGGWLPGNLKLRCRVFGDRHTRELLLDGVFGKLVIKVDGVTAEWVAKNDVEGVLAKASNTLRTRAATTNRNRVNAILDKLLALHAESFRQGESDDGQHPGILDFKLDGRLTQITWTVGAGGATTRASFNNEHNIPTSSQRQASEAEARNIKIRNTKLEGAQTANNLQGPQSRDARAGVTP